MIYRFVFNSLPKPANRATAKQAEPAALLRVCRSIRSEASADYIKWVCAELHSEGDNRRQLRRACLNRKKPEATDPNFDDYLAARIEIDLKRSQAADAFQVLMELLGRCIRRPGYDFEYGGKQLRKISRMIDEEEEEEEACDRVAWT